MGKKTQMYGLFFLTALIIDSECRIFVIFQQFQFLFRVFFVGAFRSRSSTDVFEMENAW